MVFCSEFNLKYENTHTQSCKKSSKKWTGNCFVIPHLLRPDFLQICIWSVLNVVKECKHTTSPRVTQSWATLSHIACHKKKFCFLQVWLRFANGIIDIRDKWRRRLVVRLVLSTLRWKYSKKKALWNSSPTPFNEVKH